MTLTIMVNLCWQRTQKDVIRFDDRGLEPLDCEKGRGKVTEKGRASGMGGGIVQRKREKRII